MGRHFLEFQLKRIEESGAYDEVVLITGFLSKQIEEKVRTFKTDINIKIVYNPFYTVSNNFMSLWFAKDDMDEDFVITNGDNLFEHQVYKDIANIQDEGIFLTINNKTTFDDDDMKVMLDKSGYIKYVSKRIPAEEANTESVGLVRVKGKIYRKIFSDKLKDLAHNKEFLNVFWLEMFNELTRSGFDIKTFDMTGKSWQEVDFHIDVGLARALVQEKVEKIEKKEKES